MIHGYAYFVSRPRVMADLLRPHPIDWEQANEDGVLVVPNGAWVDRAAIYQG